VIGPNTESEPLVAAVSDSLGPPVPPPPIVTVYAVLATTGTYPVRKPPAPPPPIAAPPPPATTKYSTIGVTPPAVHAAFGSAFSCCFKVNNPVAIAYLKKLLFQMNGIHTHARC
jgi:hypothetical protein